MKLTTEERIKRIEMAPAAMQVSVAKAFLRDDIDDEDIQYLFNEDDINELVEDGTIENINREEPEGIGASGFSMRTTKPGKGNKNYIKKASGGWSPCITGNPTDKDCNTLSNCVGYANGRANEIINEIRGTAKSNVPMSCNAEDWVEKAKAAGFKTGSTPKVGAIMCWRKGQTGNKTDGAGHVAIVEKVYSNNKVYTSESGWGNAKTFWNSTRTNSNGRWGSGSAYTFRCFIYLPDDVQKVIDGNVQPTPPEPKPTPTSTLKVGDKVKIIGTGNGSSKGTANTAYGIGWTRKILKIYEGRPYPYRVGNSKGTTGYYKADDLKKK